MSSAVAATVLVALLLAGPLAPKAAAGTPLPLLDVTFATLLNTTRLGVGVGPLTVDPQLSSVALGWSQNMATTGVMAHNPAVRTQVVGWSKIGENVGYGNAVQQIFDALVASPVHMRNISDGEFTRVGVATVSDATGRLWTTHVFMRPGGTTAAPAPRTTTAPAAPAPLPPKSVGPAPSTAAPTTKSVTTAAPVRAAAPAPSSATAAPSAPPVDVVVAGRPGPIEGPAPTVLIGSASPDASSEQSVPAPLLAGASLLGLLVLGATGFAVRRRIT